MFINIEKHKIMSLDIKLDYNWVILDRFNLKSEPCKGLGQGVSQLLHLMFNYH
jgi:hypothetical protein